jgi:hypothetical protein
MSSVFLLGILKKVKTLKDAQKFIEQWTGATLVVCGQFDAQRQAESIVAEARRKGTLDLLGVKTGLRSDAQSARIKFIWSVIFSAIAVGISAGALVVSILVFYYRR